MAGSIDSVGIGVNYIKIRDESIDTVPASTILNILPSLHPVFCSDGLDNLISEENDWQDVLTKYGSDFADMNAYGQQNLLVQQVLQAGGIAYICRLLPDNARYASLILKIGVKAVEEIPLYKRDIYGDYELDEEGNKIPILVDKTVIREVTNPDGTTSSQEVIEKVPATTSGVKFKVIIDYPTERLWEKFKTVKRLARGLKIVNTDDDGYEVFPLAFMYYYARGRCGENYGFTIDNDFRRDEKVSDGRRYLMNLVHKTSAGAMTLAIGKNLSFSFNPYARVSPYLSALEGLQKVYQNYDQNQHKKQIQIETYMDNYQQFSNYVANLLSQEHIVSEGLDPDYEFVSPNNDPNPVDAVDYIFGYDRNGSKYDDVVIADDSANLKNPQYFKGGTDGDFDTLTGEDLVNCKKELLKKFYHCEIDTEHIADVLQCDAGIQFDANYDVDIKLEMAKIINQRPDICTVWDCGETEDIYEAIAVAKELRASISKNGENFCCVPHFGTTTNRTVNVRVSGTYEFAYGIMSLYKRAPFAIYAGYPNYQGAVKHMLFDWVVTETIPKGWYEKQAKENRLYYAIDFGKAVQQSVSGNTTGKNVYFYSNANFYEEKISKLSEFRNGILINDIRRVLLLVLCKYTFDTEGAEAAMTKAREELQTIFSTRYPKNIQFEMTLYQTDRDKLLNEASIDVAVTFPDVFEVWNATIIAKRTSSED